MYQQSRIKMGILGAVLATALGLGVTGVFNTAVAAGWYGGVGVGQAIYKDQSATCGSLGSIMSSRSSCTFDLTNTGWKLFGGYQFNDYFAGEMSYLDFGKARASAKGTLSGSAATGNADFEAKAVDAVMVATLPLGEALGAFGRVGLFHWDVRAPGSASVTGGGATASTNPHKTGFDITLGAGVKYDFTQKIGMRAAWDRYKNVGDQKTTGESFSVDLFSISLVYSF